MANSSFTKDLFMELTAPLFRQKKNSVYCGYSVVRMLLAYYGINKSDRDLLKEVKVHENWGTYMPQWGIYLMEQGFKVEIVTLNPKLFSIPNIGIDQIPILARLNKILKSSKSELDKSVISSYIDYIQKGGTVTVKIPSREDIVGEIANRRPLLAELTTNFLLGLGMGFNFHFNVITGIDSRYIYVNDPMWSGQGGKHRYFIDHYLFGLYASSYGSPDEGCLMKVKRA